MLITTESKLNGLNILNRDNLLFINEKEVSSYLMKSNPVIKSIKIRKKFPQTMIMQIEDRLPVAKIITGIDNMYIDNDGIILTSNNNYPSFPKIIVSNISIGPNKKADWRVIKALSFINEARKQSIIIEQISADDTSNVFSAITSNGMIILIPYDADPMIKASSLQVIILRFTIVGKNITKLDFRFDKPVVTLSNGEKISSSF